VTLTSGSGATIQGAVVTFSTSSGLVTFTPTSASALTNSSGVASVTLSAASVDSAGATYITASTSIYIDGTDTTVTSNQVGISVSGGTVTLGTLTVGTSPISAYGTSSLSVPVLINGVPATVPISVTFTSPCVSASKATISSPVTSSAGTAISTYKDNACASGSSDISDEIRAAVTSNPSVSVTNTITVHPTQVNNIQFISAIPATIGKKGTGSSTLPQTSLVTFKVVDSSGKAKPGIGVAFSLLPATVPGGVSLDPATGTSDDNGLVTTTVTSGTVPTPVWVVATTTVAPIVSSQSNALTITTGLPTQKFFSLAVQTHNIEAWGYDNVPSKVTISAYDRLGQPVPDGTAVNFYTEGGGGISPANCSTTGGMCTSTFLSQYSSRPSNGRVTILATAVGEESFVDLDGNDTYDSGETFYSLGDLYIDADESLNWESGEQFFLPYASEGSSACPDNALSKHNTCDATWSTNYVRRSNLIILSSTEPLETSYTVTMGTNCLRTATLLLRDVNGNTMPAGTTISTANNYVYYKTSGATTNSTASVNIDSGSPIPDSTSNSGTNFTITIDGTDCAAPNYPSGTVNVVVTSPKGLTTKIPVTVN
jgi:hypothetical protein